MSNVIGIHHVFNKTELTIAKKSELDAAILNASDFYIKAESIRDRITENYKNKVESNSLEGNELDGDIEVKKAMESIQNAAMWIEKAIQLCVII